MYDYKISHFNLYLPSVVINIDFLYHFIKSSVKFKMNLRIEMLKYFKKIQFRVNELCYILNIQRHN